MAGLPGRFRTLLEGACSEAKRYGHARVTEAHLALSLLKHHPEEAELCWGAVTEAMIRERYLAKMEKGNRVGDPDPALLALLERAAAQPDAVAALCSMVNEALRLRPDAARSENTGVEPGTGEEAAAKASESSESPRKARIRDPQEAKAFLRARVLGQDEAIERVLSRLIVTRADLDLKPQRPDGVFLFAGPTGVGKTELAKALGEYLSPTAAAFVRLDMSEYQEAEFGIAKLLGPGPGYVGYNEPSNWLTTRIRKCPDGVLLLDEVEKAHPAVWTVFLQVFDDGRLTDCRGQTAEFGDIVVIMTTNLGARAYSARPLGFVDTDEAATHVSGDVLAEVRRVLPIELFNRIDEVVVFRALDEEDLLAIAHLHIRAVCENLRSKGYELELDERAVALVSRYDYDRALGARHMLRSVERLLLPEVVRRGPGKYRVSAEGDRLVWN